MHVNCFIGMLAQATPPASGQTQTQNPLMAFLPMILLVVVFYFILIRPQQQRSKQQTKMLSALKSGDRVVTASGIIATVITVKEKSVSIRSADSKFEVTKSSITEIIPDDSPTTTVS